MDDLLTYGAERLGGMLKENSNTKVAFKSIKEVIEEISEFMRERSKRVAGGLRESCVLTSVRWCILMALRRCALIEP